MPRTRQKLDDMVQFRVSKQGKEAAIKAADSQHASLADFARRALYKAAGHTGRKERG